MKIQIHGFLMAYEDRGSGIPLLLIHGFPLNRRMWDPQIAGLADQARILAPDLRGFGESEATPGPYSLEMLADDLNAFLDALKVNQPVVVCGLSMGGYIAFAFHRRYPERVAALILAATRAGADSPEGKTGRDQMAALAKRDGPPAVAQGMLPKMLAPQTYERQPEQVERVRTIMHAVSVEGIVAALMGMKDRPDSTPFLADIRKPTLLLFGADDQIIPVKEAKALEAAIQGSELEIFPEAGHLLNLEQPERFNTAVRRFQERL